MSDMYYYIYVVGIDAAPSSIGIWESAEKFKDIEAFCTGNYINKTCVFGTTSKRNLWRQSKKYGILNRLHKDNTCSLYNLRLEKCSFQNFIDIVSK